MYGSFYILDILELIFGLDSHINQPKSYVVLIFALIKSVFDNLYLFGIFFQKNILCC